MVAVDCKKSWRAAVVISRKQQDLQTITNTIIVIMIAIIIIIMLLLMIVIIIIIIAMIIIIINQTLKRVFQKKNTDIQLLLYINLTNHRGTTNKRAGHFFVTEIQLLLYINYHHPHHIHHHSEPQNRISREKSTDNPSQCHTIGKIRSFLFPIMVHFSEKINQNNLAPNFFDPKLLHLFSFASLSMWGFF